MIDVLRGLAATFVVVYHVMHYFPLPGSPEHGPRWVQYGWTGVDLFFVISGFVISLSAFRGIDRLGSTGFRMDFARQRLARIAPLYYLTGFIFAVTLVPALFFETNAWQNWLAHAFFVHNLFPKFQGSIDGANWSVGTEMQFYLLILMIAPLLRNAKTIAIVMIFVAIAWAWRLASYYYFSPTVTPASYGMFFFQTQLPGMLDEFAIGILVAKLVRTPSENASKHLAMGALLLAVSAVGIVAVIQSANPLLHYIFFRTFLASGFGALVLLACHLSGAILMAVSLPFRYVGKISYGIYLWHLVVLVPLMQFKWLTADRALPVVLGSTALLAAVSWHFFERPFLTRFGRSSYQTDPLSEPKTHPLSDERQLPSNGFGDIGKVLSRSLAHWQWFLRLFRLRGEHRPMKIQRLVVLDLIRIFAALAVAMYHAAYLSWSSPASTPGSVLNGAASYPELTSLSHWGWVGVEIFFALSGFVIVYTAQNATAGGFAKSRLLRLFPGALICATITLCTSILIGRGTLAGLIEPYLNSVFFWPYDPYIDGQYWTLGVEVAFYAVVFAILEFRAGARLEIAIATLGSTLAVFWILVLLNAPQSVAGLTDAMSFRHRMLFLQFGCDFALGAALFFASSRGLTLWRAVGIAVCYAGALCSFVTLHGVAPLPIIIWTTAIVGIALAPIVNRRATAALGSLASAVGIAALATYPFYLLHEIVGTALLRALVISGIERFSALFLMILIVGAASIIVTVYPERWLRRGMQKLLHWPSWLGHRREPQIDRLSDGRQLANG